MEIGEGKKGRMLMIVGLTAAFVAGIIGGDYLPSSLKIWKPSAEASFENSYIGQNSYSAVHLTSGEVYIGKLDFSPKMRLEDPYVVQTVKNEQNPAVSDIQLSPLSEGLWAPKKEIFLNPDLVLFYAPVKDDSKAAEALRAAGKN